jgi:predicted Zn-ribbon and HTH transcriptional regulator
MSTSKHDQWSLTLHRRMSIDRLSSFGDELVSVSLFTSNLFPPYRADYNLTDLTFVYRANTSSIQSNCAERVTYLSLRCDHNINEVGQQNATSNYTLQMPAGCATGTCDGCTFHFLVRTPSACPSCQSNGNSFRTFVGPCKFGRQEVRKIPYPYVIDTRRCHR